MPVSYVGAGSYAAGNNASVVPGLPSGLQVGDLMVCLTAHKEDASNGAGTPAGWTQGPGGVLPGSVEMYLRLLWRFYQAGDTAPTITFSGGGSNDTTQAIIVAFRGTKSTTPIERVTLNSGSSPANFFNESFITGPAVLAGDMLLHYGGHDNDGGQTFNGYFLAGSGGGTQLDLAGSTFNDSTLGSDAALSSFFSVSTVDVPGGGVLRIVSNSNGASSLFDVLVIHQSRFYAEAGAGGAVVGGSAGAVYRKSILTVTPTGGAVLGGEAGFATRRPTFIYTPSGGVVLGGDAEEEYRQTIRIESGAGGFVLGGSAVTTLISPETYYIDPFNGADSNPGTSWALALKTFHPIGDGIIALQDGDRVRIAKTPDPIATGVFFSERLLAALPGFQYSYGWEAGVDFGVAHPLFTTHLKVVDPNRGTSGWVVVAGSNFSHTTDTTQPYISSCYRFGLVGSYTQDQLLAYKPLAATANLSGFSRLEIRTAPKVNSASAGTLRQYALSLCSDAVGQVELLRVPVEPDGINSGIFAYDGVLPDGVNSISIRVVANGTAPDSYWSMLSIIACKEYGSADYVGHFSEFRFGDHEGAVWVPVSGFTESSGNRAMLSTCHTAAAALHNTSMQLFIRTAVSWQRNIRTEAGLTGTDFVGSFTVREIMEFDPPFVKTTFRLLDARSIPSTPITITGGYDTGTGLVTGRTAILHRPFEIDYSQQFRIPPFMLADSQNITFKNIDIYAHQCAMFGIQGDNTGLRFEDCELLSHMHKASASVGLASMVAHKIGTVPVLTNSYFKNCLGNSMYHYTRNQNETGNQFDLNSISQYVGNTLDNCVLTTWCGIPLPVSNALGFNTPAVLVGDLKIYCVANAVRVDGAYTATDTTQCPSFASGAPGTVYIYGAGAFLIAPVASADGATTGVYVFPKFVLENTFLAFMSNREMNALSGAMTRGGDVEYMEVPEIALITTAATRNSRMNSEPFYFTATHLVGTHNPNTPPLHVKKFTHTGGWWGGSGDRRVAVAYSAGGAIQVSDIDLTGATGFNYRLVENSNSTQQDQGVYGERLYIVDGLVASPTSYESANYMVGPYGLSGFSQGLYDFRGVTLENTNASQNIYAGSPGYVGSRIRFLDCDISNPSAAAYRVPTSSAESVTAYPTGSSGFDGGVIFENCNILVDAADTTAMPADTGTEFAFAATQTAVEPRYALTIIDDTIPSHGVYYKPSHAIEKDFTIFRSLNFSWRTRHSIRLALPLSFNLPLATVPIRAGSLVTITIWSRRASLSSYCGLIVHHNGVAGDSTPQDFEEVIELNTAAVDTWQMLTVQFTSVRSGLIDIAWTHFGVENSYAWLSDLVVVET